MAKRGDLFIRVSLDYGDHPKIASLSDAAFRAHIEMILYCRKYETDGIIRNPVANRLGSRWDTDVLTELQTNDDDAPSLRQLPSGDYELHGYAEMQETRAEIAARRRKNSKNGKLGGRPPKPNKTQSVSESVTQSLTESGAQKKAETETETETELTQHVRESFESWWSHYPKKVDKGAARKAFKAALKKTDLETLTEGADRYAESVTGVEPRFIKNPSTWLNAEAWENESSSRPALRKNDPWTLTYDDYAHPEERAREHDSHRPTGSDGLAP